MVVLNPFQQLMTEWDALSPYNAIHILTLQGQPNIERWQSCIDRLCKEIGLGRPERSDKGDNIEFGFFTSSPLMISSLTKSEEINLELARPFLETDIPIRFSIRKHQDDYDLIVTYSHWLADSYAIRSFLSILVTDYFNLSSELPVLTLASPKFADLYPEFRWYHKGMTLIAQLFEQIQRAKRLLRFPLPDPLNFSAHYVDIPIPDLLKLLQVKAKSHGVTVNDIFITAIGIALLEQTAETRKNKRKKWFKPKRNQIGIGSIVDIRNQAESSLDYVFGQYLSSATVILSDDERHDFLTCLHSVAKQTQEHKTKRQPVKNYALWQWSLWLWRFIKKPRQRAVFFHKNAPVMAGISNINLDNCATWNSLALPRFQGKVVNYQRISPTGPLIPLVFVISTFHGHLTLGATYRLAVYSKQTIDQIVRRIITSLTSTFA